MNKRKYSTLNLLASMLICLLVNTSQASGPGLSFTPDSNYSGQRILNPADTAIVKYVLQNTSSRTHTFVMNAILGTTVVPTTTRLAATPGIPNCAFNSSPDQLKAFINLAKAETCTLVLEIAADALGDANINNGPVFCVNGSPFSCYRPSIADSLNISVTGLPATLGVSVSSLALSVNNTALNAALTGNARQVTITNTGTNRADNVGYTLSSPLPSGTTITPASCGTIAPGDTCVLTITPSTTNPAPAAVTLKIQGQGATLATSTVPIDVALNLLTYGSLYQSGYVFSIDDTTVNTGSIGGKVAALENQTPTWPFGFIWSSMDTSTDSNSGHNPLNVVYDAIPGIYENSVAPGDACTGNTDGACNTGVITAFYPTIPTSNYAAGLCKATINGYSDWYLPAICEMGYLTDLSSTTPNNNCGGPTSPIVPLLQNMQSNLLDNLDNPNLAFMTTLNGLFWSSTEYSGNIGGSSTSVDVWYETFDSIGGKSNQNFDNKRDPTGVRCVRAMTQP